MSAAAAIAAVEGLAERVRRAEHLLEQIAQAPVVHIDGGAELVNIPAEVLAEIRAQFA